MRMMMCSIHSIKSWLLMTNTLWEGMDLMLFLPHIKKGGRFQPNSAITVICIKNGLCIMAEFLFFFRGLVCCGNR